MRLAVVGVGCSAVAPRLSSQCQLFYSFQAIYELTDGTRSLIPDK